MKNFLFVIAVLLFCFYVSDLFNDKHKYQMTADGQYILETDTGRVWKWKRVSTINTAEKITKEHEGYTPIPYNSTPSFEPDGVFYKQDYTPFKEQGIIMKKINEIFKPQGRK